jgi:hypothetical protein
MRRLLLLLCCAIAVAGIGIASSLGLERLNDTRERIAVHEQQIRELQGTMPGLDDVTRQRDTLKAEVDQLSSRLYARGETDPYAFGAVVRRMITSLGMKVLSYQLVEAKGQSYLEFSVTGSARAFVLFLREVSQAPRLWSVPTLSLSVQQGTGMIDATLRIGYVVGDA